MDALIEGRTDLKIGSSKPCNPSSSYYHIDIILYSAVASLQSENDAPIFHFTDELHPSNECTIVELEKNQWVQIGSSSKLIVTIAPIAP